MAAAEMTNILQLGEMLNAEFSYGWPPPHNDEKTMQWFFNKIYNNPEYRGWLIWYFVHTKNDKRIVVGNGGFTGPANDRGIVECGYSILKPVQQNGFASEALAGLIDWAFTHEKVTRILARIVPNNFASKSVLEKNGFVVTDQDCRAHKICYQLEKRAGDKPV